MIKKEQSSAQMNFLMPGLAEQLQRTHSIYQLALATNWDFFDKEFSKYYRLDFGRPALPIRLMVSLLILKHLRNLSDESVVEQWAENVYYQFFSGQTVFTPKPPCSPTELVNFRDRIGPEGIEKILQESIRINGKDGNEKDVIADTTVQEKNITYPTDSKLHQKIITKCIGIAQQEDLTLRQSYSRTLPKLRYEQRGRNHPKHAAKARKADRKIKTIAGRLVREIDRNLAPDNPYQSDIEIFKRILRQNRNDSNKIYSLHEPHVNCISKGKDHKKYEFGNKVSILRTKSSGVIVGALSIEQNTYDGKTLEPALEQYKRLLGTEPQKVLADLGYRGKKAINETKIVTPADGKKIQSSYQRRKHKKDMARRSSIEPVIGHLKQDNRLGRNYHKGIKGDQINVMLAAAAFNFKRFMRLKLNTLLQRFYYAVHCVLAFITDSLRSLYPQSALSFFKMTF
jgi:IS5 family transposase